MPPVNILIKPISGLCNMKCDYCFYYDEAEKRQQASYGLMSDETLKNVIRKVLDSAEGYCSIAFQGGEICKSAGMSSMNIVWEISTVSVRSKAYIFKWYLKTYERGI